MKIRKYPFCLAPTKEILATNWEGDNSVVSIPEVQVLMFHPLGSTVSKPWPEIND